MKSLLKDWTRWKMKSKKTKKNSEKKLCSQSENSPLENSQSDNQPNRWKEIPINISGGGDDDTEEVLQSKSPFTRTEWNKEQDQMEKTR